MAKRTYFPAFFSYQETLEDMSDAEVGRVFRACLLYAETGEEMELSGAEKVAFKFIKRDIDKSNAEYSARCEANTQNGSKGGRPSASDTEESEENPKKPKKTQRNPKKPKESEAPEAEEVGLSEKPKKPKEKEKEKEKENISVANATDSYAPDGAEAEPEAEDNADRVPYAKIAEHFKALCPSYSPIRGITGKRRTLVTARWKENPSLDEFDRLFRTAEASEFMRGANDRGWKADFDWMMAAGNFNKVLEGKYNNRDAPAEKPQGSFNTDEYWLTALKRTYETPQEG